MVDGTRQLPTTPTTTAISIHIPHHGEENSHDEMRSRAARIIPNLIFEKIRGKRITS